MLASGEAHVVCTKTTVSATMSKSIEPRIVTAARLDSGAAATAAGAVDGVGWADTVRTRE